MATTPQAPYLAPALKDQGYTGATGATPYRPATTAQTDALKSIYNDATLTNVPRTVGPNATSININFEGTKNNGKFPAPGESPTNISRLNELQIAATGEEKNNIYVPGVGAQTVPTGTLDASGNPANGSSPSNWESTPWKAGEIANASVKDTYALLVKRVEIILADNPNAEIALNLSGFSRGGAMATALANLIEERGIPGLGGPGQVRIATLVLADPVDQTGGALNVKPPTNVDNTLVLVALSEGRHIMPAMVVSADARMVGVPGAHADIGGSFNPQGISAVTLGVIREFLNTSGNPVAPVPDNLKPNWDEMQAHNSSLDNYGNVIWSANDSHRPYEGAGRGSPSVQSVLAIAPKYNSIPTSDDGSAAYTATYPDGKVITKLTQDGKLSELQISVPQGAGSVTTAFDAKGGFRSTTTQNTDDDGNTLYVTTLANGSFTTRLLNSAGHVIEPTLQLDTVNGQDLQSDQYVAPPPADSFHNALLNAFQNSQNSTGTGTQYAQADTGTASDAGGGGSNAATQPLNFANLTPAQLAQALQSSSTGGDYGAGQLGGNSFVPISATSKVLTDAQGEVIGEANTLPNGYTRFTDKDGNTAYTTPGGQAISQTDYQLGLATAGAGLTQSIIGLQNWDKQTTLGQVGTVVGMYNQINTLSEGALGAGSGLGSLGSLGAGLGFLSALESGDVGRSVYSGLSLVETLTSTTTISAAGVSSTSGWVTANLPGGNKYQQPNAFSKSSFLLSEKMGRRTRRNEMNRFAHRGSI